MNDYKNDWAAERWISRFFVEPVDPGYLYVVEHTGKYKIGKSTNPAARIQAAKTWLPNMELVGVKPFWKVSEKEKLLHVGLSVCWYDGEWFEPFDEGYRGVMIDDFKEFSDTDINKNSVDFIYWYNSSGMAEFAIEQNRQQKSVRKFIRHETTMRKK